MMASVCVNSVGMPLESLHECPALYPRYDWFNPRMPFSQTFPNNGGSKNDNIDKPEPDSSKVDTSKKSETKETKNDSVEFEFRPYYPVSMMLPADELFSDGKLIPLQIARARANAECAPKVQVRLRDPMKSQLMDEITLASDDALEFSPKAPKCSSRWKELLCLKKTQNSKPAFQKCALAASMVENAKSIKYFLNKNPKSTSSSDHYLRLPLLRDSNSESVSISSRPSLSLSSSGADQEDFSRLSFDNDNPSPNQLWPTPLLRNQRKVQLAKDKSSPLEGRIALSISHGPTRRVSQCGEIPRPRCASVNSPRLNASGKVIFNGYGRSSSGPSKFNGRLRPWQRGIERSFSDNIRVTPILHVPLCTLRGSGMPVSVFGLGQLFSSPQKVKKSFHNSYNGVSNGTKAKNEKLDC